MTWSIPQLRFELLTNLRLTIQLNILNILNKREDLRYYEIINLFNLSFKLATRRTTIEDFNSDEEEESRKLRNRKVKRIDVLRQKQYKQKIARNSSSALKRLETATQITLLGKVNVSAKAQLLSVLMADFLTIYICSRMLIDDTLHSLNLLDTIQDASDVIQTMSIDMRTVEFSAQGIGPENYTNPQIKINTTLDRIRSELSFFEDTLENKLIADLSKENVRGKEIY